MQLWFTALAAILLVLPALGAKKETRPPAAVPVLAAVAATRPMAYTMGAVSTVEPIESVAVRAQVTGVVTEIGFREGEDVRAGQLQFQIDPRPSSAAVTSTPGANWR